MDRLACLGAQVIRGEHSTAVSRSESPHRPPKPARQDLRVICPRLRFRVLRRSRPARHRFRLRVVHQSREAPGLPERKSLQDSRSDVARPLDAGRATENRGDKDHHPLAVPLPLSHPAELIYQHAQEALSHLPLRKVIVGLVQLNHAQPPLLPRLVTDDATPQVRAIVVVGVVAEDLIQKTVCLGGTVPRQIGSLLGGKGGARLTVRPVLSRSPRVLRVRHRSLRLPKVLPCRRLILRLREQDCPIDRTILRIIATLLRAHRDVSAELHRLAVLHVRLRHSCWRRTGRRSSSSSPTPLVPRRGDFHSIAPWGICVSRTTVALIAAEFSRHRAGRGHRRVRRLREQAVRVQFLRSLRWIRIRGCSQGRATDQERIKGAGRSCELCLIPASAWTAIAVRARSPLCDAGATSLPQRRGAVAGRVARAPTARFSRHFRSVAPSTTLPRPSLPPCFATLP